MCALRFMAGLPVMAAALPLVVSASASAAPPSPAAIASAPDYDPASGLQPPFTISSAFVPARSVQVWLPPGYARGHRRYPVIYMADGQNIFDTPAPLSGHGWQVHRALARLIGEGRARPAIIVGVWSNDNRLGEYMPDRALAAAPADALGGLPVRRDQVSGDAYLRFLVGELKPLIDARYRTRSGPSGTMLMGSSMGGLIAAYAMTRYPAIFGAAACLSTSWPVGKGFNLPDFLAHLPGPAGHRFYFDYGTGTNDGVIEPFQQRIDAAMARAGYVPGRTLMTRAFPGNAHTESAWAGRVDVPLAFLLGH